LTCTVSKEEVYKKDVKDLRKSPPLKLIHILEDEKCKVDYYDPIIPYLNIEGIQMNSIELTSNNVKKYDAVLIAADHTNVRYDLILKAAKFIFDIRNVYKNKSSPKIIKL
jgi:UDP-N-acetyl-D-mannosaminuronate dehydrogenase